VSGIPQAQQQLVINGAPLAVQGTVKDANVTDGDVIMVLPKQQAAPPARQQQQQQQQSAPHLQLNPDGSFVHPEQVMELLRGNPQVMDQMRRAQPEKCTAIENGDVQALQNLMRQVCRSAVWLIAFARSSVL
jgi:hypothetical protein